jgi:hypothetical protein
MTATAPCVRGTRTVCSAIALGVLFLTGARAQHSGAAPLIDNERVTVWEATAGDPLC